MKEKVEKEKRKIEKASLHRRRVENKERSGGGCYKESKQLIES